MEFCYCQSVMGTELFGLVGKHQVMSDIDAFKIGLIFIFYENYALFVEQLSRHFLRLKRC